MRNACDGFAVVLLLAALVLSGLGCSRLRQPAAVPSDQKTALVWNADTRDVLMNASDKDIQVLASALESNAETGSVIYIDHQGWVYNPDGTLFVDQLGKPIKTRTRVIAKLNSMKELAQMEGVEEVEYSVGGYEYGKDLPVALQGKDLCPQALRLRIKGIGKLAAVDPTAANRQAAGAERALILKGLSDLATANGAAFAVKVKAVADGVQIVTAAGADIVGKVLTAAVLPTSGVPADLLKAGVTKVVKAVIRQPNDQLADVVADGANADALQAALPK
jgi:hypothetical protein